jgi:hypothetical protein
MRVLVPGRRPGALVAVTRDDESKSQGLIEVDLESGSVTRLREAPASLGRDPAFGFPHRPAAWCTPSRRPRAWRTSGTSDPEPRSPAG